MRKSQKHIAVSILVICVLCAGVLYFYHHPLYVQYQKIVLNKEFVCPENQNSDAYNAYLYRFIKFYADNYPSMKLNDFLTIRYNQLVQHNCTTTLANIANNDSGNATTSSDTGDTTMGEFSQSPNNVSQ